MTFKSLVNCFVWNQQYFEKFAITKKEGGGGILQKLYHIFMYIAPFSDHSLLTPNMPFKVILRKYEVVFWWDYCTFQKIGEN